MAFFDTKNEAIEHLWLQNEILWRTVRGQAVASADNDDALKDIDAIFASRKKWQSGAEDWRLVNEVEQRIGCLLNESQLYTQFHELYDDAQRRKLPSLALHEANRRSLFEKPLDQPAGPPQLNAMRAAYLALLSHLQQSFIDKRFERKLRSGTARRLSRFGLGVLIVGILPFLVYFIARAYFPDSSIARWSFGDGTGLGLGLALLFGLLGSFFSRIIRFQAVAPGMQFDDMHAVFISPMMWLRMISGLFGALIFYFFIRSGLLAGDAFPDFTKLGSTVQVDSSAATATVAAGSFKELAKLAVWSFIAGFSERLVPDTLVKTEGRAGE